ncbi:chemotaxis protein CheD [Ruminococcaceae bacterium OttesenSCG-928-L11]|nr:chemotaxis protein CheD [Ruminococcaceae bacterium OttesenSCG-928-L11]
MSQLVVGISDLKVALPPDTLITYALGSCVGICLLDPAVHVSGLSHIMLPDSKMSPNDRNVMKFADSAIPELLRQMEMKGANRSRIKAKIAGGAQMFELAGGNNPNNTTWQIGQRNVAAVEACLRALRIPIVAKDVLLNFGRTVSFDAVTGIMTVKALNKSVKEL